MKMGLFYNLEKIVLIKEKYINARANSKTIRLFVILTIKLLFFCSKTLICQIYFFFSTILPSKLKNEILGGNEI